MAYLQCDSSFPNGSGQNRQHGGPLNELSCNPPLQLSDYLSVGTGDAWPATSPKFVGSVRFDVKASSPEDVRFTASMTDVRCKPFASPPPPACGADNVPVPGAPNLRDYTGELNIVGVYRATDHYNKPLSSGTSGPATASGTSFPIDENANDPATVADLPLRLTIPCTGTDTDNTVGSTCTFDSSANAVTPGYVEENKRQNIELQTLSVEDSGADGVASTNDGQNVFLTQGIFVP